MAHAPDRAADTRRRLLEAAVEVFAEDGYRKATIQQICRRARANIAAAHYHFGDKERLYAAAFEFAERRARADAPAEPSSDGDPETRLRHHVSWFLRRLLDPNRPAWMARLLAHELVEPTRALDRLVRRRMRANHEQIAAVIRMLLGSAATPELVRLSTLSVVSQCVFYRNSAAIISRLYPQIDPAREVEAIADHVTRFSLAALQGLRDGKTSRNHDGRKAARA
jgi:AcrR family transcriptional regulator